jgi:hypothetical protein
LNQPRSQVTGQRAISAAPAAWRLPPDLVPHNRITANINRITANINRIEAQAARCLRDRC